MEFCTRFLCVSGGPVSLTGVRFSLGIVRLGCRVGGELDLARVGLLQGWYGERRKRGKKVTYVCKGVIPQNLNWIRKEMKI